MLSLYLLGACLWIDVKNALRHCIKLDCGRYVCWSQSLNIVLYIVLSNDYGLLIHHQYQAQIHNTKLKLDMILDQKKNWIRLTLFFDPKKMIDPCNFTFVSTRIKMGFNDKVIKTKLKEALTLEELKLHREIVRFHFCAVIKFQ